MREVSILVAVLAVAVLGQALTPSTFLTTVDKQRLKRVFNTVWELKDLPTVYYGVLGYKMLGETLPDAPEVCRFLHSAVSDKSQVDALFYASNAALHIPSCALTISDVSKKVLEELIGKSSSSAQDIYFAVSSLNNFKKNIDSAAVTKALLAALKRDDSVMNLGFAFHAASLLKGDVNAFFDRVEDAVVQADEVDHKFLQLEGGVSVTANVISGAYKLAEKVNKTPPITAAQAIKFANYFVNRKTVQFPKAASSLLLALNVFTHNKFHIPIVTSLASSGEISAGSPTLKVQITDVMGSGLGDLTVTADSAVRSSDDAVILSKKAFTADKSDKSMYSVNMWEGTPAPGFYKVSVSSVPLKPDSRLVGGQGAEVTVKVLTEVTLVDVEISVGDSDQSTAPKAIKLTYPNTLPSRIEADYHQRIILKFTIQSSSTKETIRCHQTFIRLVNKKTQQEITFVAEPDSANAYKFDLDVLSKAKIFGSLSGEYTMELLIGDAVVVNPVLWKVATVELHFASQTEGLAEPPTPPMHAARPVIQHMFRKPEKRPPAVVSNAFSILVCLPLLLLFLLWAKIGVNVSNFPATLAAVGFHLCLGGIFALYGFFWLKLSMFTTIKYLFGLGVVTFLCGNNLLTKVADLRKQAAKK